MTSESSESVEFSDKRVWRCYFKKIISRNWEAITWFVAKVWKNNFLWEIEYFWKCDSFTL